MFESFIKWWAARKVRKAKLKRFYKAIKNIYTWSSDKAPHWRTFEWAACKRTENFFIVKTRYNGYWYVILHDEAIGDSSPMPLDVIIESGIFEKMITQLEEQNIKDKERINSRALEQYNKNKEITDKLFRKINE